MQIASLAAYTPAQKHSSPALVLSLFAIVMAALVFGGWSYLLDQKDSVFDPLVPETAHVDGDGDAPVTVVVFSDFQCAACGVFAAEVLPQLQADFMDAGIVRVAYRHYPLGGKDSVRAAVGAECAGQQDKFWKMHDVLYGWKGGTNVDRFPAELVRTLALGLRLDVAEFDACVRAPGTITPIDEGLRDGFAMGVRELPAVYVNGVYADGIVDYTRIRSLVLNAAAP